MLCRRATSQRTRVPVSFGVPVPSPSRNTMRFLLFHTGGRGESVARVSRSSVPGMVVFRLDPPYARLISHEPASLGNHAQNPAGDRPSRVLVSAEFA